MVTGHFVFFVEGKAGVAVSLLGVHAGGIDEHGGLFLLRMYQNALVEGDQFVARIDEEAIVFSVNTVIYFFGILV